MVAVAEGVTDLTPGPVAEWAIQTFGTHDKLALIVGILIVMALVFGGMGRAGRRFWWFPIVGFVVLAGVGTAAVVAKPGPSTTALVPVFVGLVVWIGAFLLAAEWLRNWELAEESGGAVEESGRSRRDFFVLAGAMAGVAAAAGIVGRVAGSGRRRAEESRRLLRIEGVTAPRLPKAARLDVAGLAPWATPADDFYLIDTAFIKPTIEPADWQIRIHGRVERELTLTYAELVGREITEDWITLNCVSNEVGGDLIGNAWWSGVRLAGLLAEAGPLPGADAVLQTSDDGWTCGTPLAALVDDRNAMLAVAMNGEPLPIEHGFPVRTIVPGLYGYVSACKWVVDLEVTSFDEISAYWTDKGWSEQGPVKLGSRIDVPESGATVGAGEIVVAGVAWLQHTGVRAVEVSIDGGRWQAAALAKAANLDTWVQWHAAVTVEPGEHEVRVRAVSRENETQTGVVTDVLPDGATGWHSVAFTATAG